VHPPIAYYGNSVSVPVACWLDNLCLLACQIPCLLASALDCATRCEHREYLDCILMCRILCIWYPRLINHETLGAGKGTTKSPTDTPHQAMAPLEQSWVSGSTPQGANGRIMSLDQSLSQAAVSIAAKAKLNTSSYISQSQVQTFQGAPQQDQVCILLSSRSEFS
jgi:hypothetical protein